MRANVRAMVIVLVCLAIALQANASLESFVYSLDFYYNANNALSVMNQADYMLDLNNNSIPDMLYLNLTTNVSSGGNYLFVIDLEDQDSVVTMMKNESVSTSTTKVILNTSTDLLTGTQFNYSIRVYNASDLLVFRKFRYQTMSYPQYESSFKLLGIADYNLGNNIIQINATVNATRAETANASLVMIFNGSSLQATREVSIISGQNVLAFEFDNETIKRTHYNGTYNITSITLGQKTLPVSYMTASYNFETFARTSYFKSYHDGTIDFDSDGLFDYLGFNYTIEIKTEGAYTIASEISDMFDNFLTKTTKTVTLPVGTAVVEMLVNGSDIYKSRIDGPYRIKIANLNDSVGTIVDAVIEPYTTATENLSASAFERPELPDLFINMTTLFNNVTLYTDANVTINNIGNADAFNVIVDISDTRNNDTTEALALLSPGSIAAINVSIFNASNKIIAIVDFDNVIDEHNESNNIIAIGNDPPTTPTNMTCGEVTTKLCTEPRTYSQFIRINASGSVDPDNDNITYVIEAYYNHSTIGLGLATTITSFNDSLPSSNLYFFDKKDVIRYITLPKTAIVSGANFTLRGLSGGRWNHTGNRFSVAPQVSILRGMSYDPNANTLWIGDTISGSAQDVSEWNPNSGALIRFCSPSFIQSIEGVYSDGTFLWVADDIDTPTSVGKVFKMSETCAQESQPFPLHPSNDDPRGITFDGTYFYTSEFSTIPRKIFKYSSSGAFIEFFNIDSIFVNSFPADLEYESINNQFFACRGWGFCARYTPSFSFVDNNTSPNNEEGITDNATLIWKGRPADGAVYEYYKFDSYPDDIFIDVGMDGDQEFNYTGEFSSTVNVPNFANKLNSLLKICKPVDSNCTIPVRFHTDTYGILNYSNVNIVYQREEETSNYFFGVIGSHNETSTFIWNLSTIQNQTGVQLRARAIDLNGSNLHSGYFAPSMSITINSSFVPNLAPYPQSVVITPKYPNDEDTLDCAFNVTDADDPSISVNVTWVKNMMPYTDDTENFTNVASGSIVHTTAIGDIEPEDTALYDEWICKIIAYDEEEATMDLSSGKVIVPKMIANFTLLTSSVLTGIFEFAMLNPGKTNEDYLWTLEPGDGNVINATSNMTLVRDEDAFVYVEHTYSTGGTYNVTATVTNFAITDDEMITVEVTQPGD